MIEKAKGTKAKGTEVFDAASNPKDKKKRSR
jgi:hypothetical protein